MNKDMLVEAIVKRTIQGRHGRFTVTSAKGFTGSVTFSLENGAWQEKEDPEPGTYVVLSDIRKRRIKGKRVQWQAHKARFFRIEDEEKKEVSQ